MKPLDLSNKVFNKLTALEKARSKNGKTYWICRCECGNLTTVQTYDLTSGHTKSCGCERNNKDKKIDITNQVFNKLTAIRPTNKRSGHCVVWECQCECGAITYVSVNDLKKGNTKSCGCIKSAGEEKISKILSENNILFNRQKTLLGCRFPETNACAVFDFYIETSEEEKGFYLIEYDGIQHFETKTGGWNNIENLKSTQIRDEYKNKWCKENGITLIRIPYTHFNKLTINDLIPGRSAYGV